MRTFTDVKCNRCGWTESAIGVDAADLSAAHVCADSARTSDSTVTTRIVPGPGERGRDEESVR